MNRRRPAVITHEDSYDEEEEDFWKYRDDVDGEMARFRAAVAAGKPVTITRELEDGTVETVRREGRPAPDKET